MGLDFKVVAAVARKDLRQYLGNPVGYVFVTLFIAATAVAAFLTDAFFARNLADLAELNRYMPAILVFFVPALTMGAWADERRAGTDELLLTMPVRDSEVVLGKYLGVLAMYTISLGFSLAHVVVLHVLGDPDTGLMVSTYFGYWLMGAMFCAIGLVASMFTRYSVIAFILGGLGCGATVIAGTVPWASGLVGVAVLGLLGALVFTVARGHGREGGWVGLAIAWAGVLVWRGLEPSGEDGEVVRGAKNGFEELFARLSVTDHFHSFGEGVARLGDGLYFAGGIVLMLYLGSFLLGRRHW